MARRSFLLVSFAASALACGRDQILLGTGIEDLDSSTSSADAAGTGKVDASARDGGTAPPRSDSGAAPPMDSGPSCGVTLSAPCCAAVPCNAGLACVDGTCDAIVPLTASSSGFVSPDVAGTPNSVGVIGSWYAFGDGWGTEGVDGGVGAVGERGPCELLGGFASDQCSQITSPLPPDFFLDGGPFTDGAPPGYDNGFPPTPEGSQTFCMSGSAAEVLPDEGGLPDYNDIYGIGIGLDLDNPSNAKAAYDAPAHHVIGLEFTVTAKGAFPPLRVEFPTTEAPLDPYVIEPKAGGFYRVLWTDLETPYPPVLGQNIGYVPADGGLASLPRFEPAHLFSIQFLVTTNATSMTPVDSLCVSGMSAIVH